MTYLIFYLTAVISVKLRTNFSCKSLNQRLSTVKGTVYGQYLFSCDKIKSFLYLYIYRHRDPGNRRPRGQVWQKHLHIPAQQQTQRGDPPNCKQCHTYLHVCGLHWDFVEWNWETRVSGFVVVFSFLIWMNQQIMGSNCAQTIDVTQ